MRWLRASLVAAGLLSTGCLMGGIAAGTSAVLVGAGFVAFTCYDRVTVVVTDRLTGTKLCDAKVSFTKGSSETVATSCGQAALSAGKYKMRVEREGLVPFEQPVEVVRSEDCGSTTQTMLVALDRPNREQAPQQVVPRREAPAADTAAPPVAAPPPAAPPAVTTPPAAAAPADLPNAQPSPPSVPAPPSAAPPSAAPPTAPTATPSASPPAPAPSSSAKGAFAP